MLKTKLLLSLISILLINGCTLLGAVLDSKLDDQFPAKKEHRYFQDLGKKADQNFLQSEDEKFAKQRAHQRNCKYGTEDKEACKPEINP